MLNGWGVARSTAGIRSCIMRPQIIRCSRWANRSGHRPDRTTHCFKCAIFSRACSSQKWMQMHDYIIQAMTAFFCTARMRISFLDWKKVIHNYLLAHCCSPYSLNCNFCRAYEYGGIEDCDSRWRLPNYVIKITPIRCKRCVRVCARSICAGRRDAL